MKTFAQSLSLFCISLIMAIAQASSDFKIIDNGFSKSFVNQNSINKQNKQGNGVIQGQLYDQDSGDPIVDVETRFSAFLYKQHPRFDSWDFVAYVDTEQGHYELSGLEPGNYAVVVGWKWSESENPTYENAYLPALWSPTGDPTCDRCEPVQSQAISLTESEPNFQADFQLSKAAVLELQLLTDEYEFTASSLPLYSIDESGIKRGYLALLVYSFFNPIAPEPITLKALFLLPKGEHRIFLEQGWYKGAIYGEGNSCRHCEYNVRFGQGDTITLSENQTTYAKLPINKLTGAITGHVKSDSIKPQIIDFNKDQQSFYPLEISQDLADSEYPYAFKITGLADDYYFLNFNNNINYNGETTTDPNYYAYSTIYGGGYCDHPHCDFDNLTPILVRENQNTQLRPQDVKPIGGHIIGHFIDPKEPDYLPIEDTVTGYVPSDRNNWISVYNEQQQLITTNVAPSSFRVNLPPGHYYLKTGHGQLGFTNRYYASTLYPDIDCAAMYCDFSKGTLVEVKSAEDTIVDDIQLKRGQGLKGRVTDTETGEAVSGIKVQVLDGDQHLISSELTNADGYYSHWGLLPGNYYLRTDNGNHSLNDAYKIYQPYTGGYINQLYPNTPCLNNQCNFNQVSPITITTDDIDNHNFNLSVGEPFSGTVTDINSTEPLYNKRINVFQLDGTQVGSYLTDKLGSFTTDALIPGSYKMLVEGGYLYLDKAVGNDEKPCLFDACELADAELVTLSDEPLNIQLTHKKDLLPHYTGMWYNPEESGHGLQFEVLDQDNAAILYVTWFAHVNGEPIWLTGSGPLLGNQAFVDLIITDGQDFPESMNAQIWGELRVKFDNLNQATLSWKPLLDGFNAGELAVERLTIPVIPEQEDIFYSGNPNLDACLTGSYYDPERSGEGIQITALGNPVDHLSFNWYTYLGDEQFWFTGQGDFNQDTVESQAYYTKGVNFTPDFNPDNLEIIPWGDVTIRKIPQGKIEVEFMPNSDHSDFEQRTVQLIRNSTPYPLSCIVQ